MVNFIQISIARERTLSKTEPSAQAAGHSIELTAPSRLSVARAPKHIGRQDAKSFLCRLTDTAHHPPATSETRAERTFRQIIGFAVIELAHAS